MFGLFSRNRNKPLIDKLHGEIMAGVLNPALYLSCGVPDTFEGRFEMLVLHGALTTRRESPTTRRSSMRLTSRE